MVGDRIWLSRIVPWDAPYVVPLNTELYTDFAELRRERETQDAGIVAFVDGLSEARIAGTLRYATTSGEPFRKCRSERSCSISSITRPTTGARCMTC